MTNTVWVHVSELSKVIQFIKTEIRMVVAGVWGEGENVEMLFNGYRVSAMQYEKDL